MMFFRNQNNRGSYKGKRAALCFNTWSTGSILKYPVFFQIAICPKAGKDFLALWIPIVLDKNF